MYVYVFGGLCRQGMVAHTWNPHIQETEAGEWEV